MVTRGWMRGSRKRFRTNAPDLKFQISDLTIRRMPERTVRVGNAGGYWGDDLGAMQRQLRQGRLDYLTQDFLAEITMSILQKQKVRRAELGYASDFLDQLRQCMPDLGSSSTRIISNAGGINPLGCAEQVARLARQAGLAMQVAVVEGDDLMNRLDELLAAGHLLANMETGQPLSSIRDRIESANAYLGTAPVVEALRTGARIVVTGRVTDTGITAAPPTFEFGWDLDDWDLQAAAVVAGHILECGAQATGGNLTDWEAVPSFANIGYPIAEFRADGSFLVTKAPGSGGIVNRQSVASQLVYEMGDPRCYITPDVVADFSTIELEESGPDQITISGVKGSARPDSLKVSISYQDGYKAHGTMIVSRPSAVAKCRTMAETFWTRLGLEFEETCTELVGFNACHVHQAPPVDPPEVLLRLGVRDPDAGKVEEFAKLFTSLILNTVSGVAIVGARPKVQSVVAYWPCLIPASEVTPVVTPLESRKQFAVPWRPAPESGESVVGQPPRPAGGAPPSLDSAALESVPLSRICYGRSGDKGDTCNIGLVARNSGAYQWMCQHLTAELVKEFFGEICRGSVERFEIPNLLALNFLLHESLGGGGTVSLRIDPQGKTLADALLQMPVEVPEGLGEA